MGEEDGREGGREGGRMGSEGKGRDVLIHRSQLHTKGCRKWRE